MACCTQLRRQDMEQMREQRVLAASRRMPRTRQSRPDSGLGCQYRFLKKSSTCLFARKLLFDNTCGTQLRRQDMEQMREQRVRAASRREAAAAEALQREEVHFSGAKDFLFLKCAKMAVHMPLNVTYMS